MCTHGPKGGSEGCVKQGRFTKGFTNTFANISSLFIGCLSQPVSCGKLFTAIPVMHGFSRSTKGIERLSHPALVCRQKAKKQICSRFSL